VLPLLIFGGGAADQAAERRGSRKWTRKLLLPDEGEDDNILGFKNLLGYMTAGDCRSCQNHEPVTPEDGMI